MLLVPKAIQIIQNLLLLNEGRIAFESIIGPLHELFCLSDKVCASVVQDSRIIVKMIEKLSEEKTALVRVKIVKLLCKVWKHVRNSMTHENITVLQSIISRDPSILVREIGKIISIPESLSCRNHISINRLSFKSAREDIEHFVLSE